MTDQPNTALKEIFDRARIEQFASDTKIVWDDCDEARFIALATEGLHYVKKNGTPSRKVFKLKTFTPDPDASQSLGISQSIRDFTTRTHNAGFHRVELMLNGQTVAESGFELSV